MPLVPNETSVDERVATRLPDPGPATLEGLVPDVRVRGILVDLLVTHTAWSWMGHRRLAAARKLGLAEVLFKRVQVGDGDTGLEEAALFCVNICRRKMNETERAVLGSSRFASSARGPTTEACGAGNGREERKRRGLVVEHASPQPTDGGQCEGVRRQGLWVRERLESVTQSQQTTRK